MVVYFQGKQKGLVTNKTNANNIAALYGDDTDDWIGQKIMLNFRNGSCILSNRGAGDQNAMISAIRQTLYSCSDLTTLRYNPKN
jgi:hypothetical protein